MQASVLSAKDAAVGSPVARDEQRETLAVGRGLVLRVLVASVTIVGGVLAAVGALTWNNEPLAALLILALAAMAAERFDFSIYGESRVSVSFVPMFSAIILAGVSGVALVVPLAILASELGRRRPTQKLLFNFGTLMMAGASAALVIHLSGPAGHPEAWPWVIVPALVAATVHYGISSLLVAEAVSLNTESAFAAVWKEKFRWLWPHYVVLGLLGLAIATGYTIMGPWGIVVFLAPPIMMHLALRQYIDRTSKSVIELKAANQELRQAHELQGETMRSLLETMHRLDRSYDTTLRALVAALGTRDTETRGHSERVADLTMAIAEEMGMARDTREWQELQWGALLHDVGKIGVPDSILRKPGALTTEEWEAMRSHPAAGYEILRDVEFLGAAAEIVYAHHESFDGSGYPSGLAGDEIPLGARIFSVADSFDAMTSDRPYRAALPPEDALAEIQRNSGSQFDPIAVDAFTKVFSRRFAPSASSDSRDAERLFERAIAST